MDKTSHQTQGEKQSSLQQASSLHELRIAFKDRQTQIAVAQAAHIRAWRSGCRDLPKNLDVIVGGASHTSRVGRLLRLHGLIKLLGQIGISAAHIFPDLEWTRPVRMGSLDDIPADTIWLKFYPRTRHRLVL